MPTDTKIDASAAALVGLIALEKLLPLLTVVRAANDEGYDTDLRTLSLAWQLGQPMDSEYSQADSGGQSTG